MLNHIVLLIGLLVPIISSFSSEAEAVPNFDEQGVTFLQQYCFGCHSGDQPTAGLALDLFLDNDSLIKQPKVWQRVLVWP